VRRELLDALLAARAAKRPALLVTDLGSGAQWLLTADGPAEVEGLDEVVVRAARAALRADRSGELEHEGRSFFLNAFNPPLRMILVGAVHIAQPLARMAALTGFDVFLIDPRQAFAADARFPGVEISGEWPDRAVAGLAPDARTAIVTLTHDPKLDDPALCVALRSDAFYIGALGSRKTHQSRLRRLRPEGFDDEALARIHGPVGLSIGAKSPAEIAVSILGQVIHVLREPAP
jgi:xanthine dehydrogenase accessory factor